MVEATISIVNSKSLLHLFGTRDQHLRQIRRELNVDIATHGDGIRVRGEPEAVAQATLVLERLKELVERRGAVTSADIGNLILVATKGFDNDNAATIEVFNPHRKIQPMTAGQATLIEAIKRYDLTLCAGPAGTGKTYLAVAMAVEALREQRIRKVVLVRPAVEAGEKLGYLPGDLQAKINPYLRPLLDAIAEMMDFEQIKRFTEQDMIEMIPLAYMRGRTLNEAFIILDEAQNTTVSQMKMFLTRMGRGSKIVVTGDTTQIDLPPQTPSGLDDAMRRLRGIDEVAQIHLSKADVVRHSLVQKIVRAYESNPETE